MEPLHLRGELADGALALGFVSRFQQAGLLEGGAPLVDELDVGNRRPADRGREVGERVRARLEELGKPGTSKSADDNASAS